jgi:DNA-binding response OmpR family regulator
MPALGPTVAMLPVDSGAMEGPPIRALIVDDDRALRLLCRVNLELDGFEVREAATVAEAEAAITAERPDVVLLDVHLGGEHTNDLLARIRGQGIPVALVTGSVDIADYRDLADAVLGKPFVPETLVGTARRLARVHSDA